VPLRDQILRRLEALPCQGIEETALGALALRSAGAKPDALLRAQQPSGAWSAFPGAGPPNAFHTALALLALKVFPAPAIKASADRAFSWLSDLQGYENHWLWKWKFRFFDRQVRFDPTKSGWPWIPGTISWVAPTALAVLAFRAWRRESSRLSTAAEMLTDRACLHGGWNAGNSVVFGVGLDPHPDFTVMALLALRGLRSVDQTVITSALDYLLARLSASTSTYSLAWGVMALSAYRRHEASSLRSRLAQSLDLARISVLPLRVLALAALALEEPTYTFQESDQ
jgi:hypothetical protein